MAKRKKSKMVFYRQMFNTSKFRVKWLWAGKFGGCENEKVHLVFAEDVTFPGRYEIIEASSGMGIIRHLKKLDELSFCRICNFIACFSNVRERAREYVRVSRLPDYVEEEW